MKDPRNWTRRDFTLTSALAILSGATITISGCSDSASPTQPTQTPPPAATPPPAPTPTPTSVTGVVGSNHGHTAVIEASELTSNATIMLDIRGSSDHPHTVELTVAELAQISAGTRVSKRSSVDQSHDHSVTFN